MLFLFGNESYSYFVLVDVYCLLFSFMLDCQKAMILYIVGLLCLFLMMPKGGIYSCGVCFWDMQFRGKISESAQGVIIVRGKVSDIAQGVIIVRGRCEGYGNVDIL